MLTTLALVAVVTANSVITFNPPTRFDHPFNGRVYGDYVHSTFQMLFKCGAAYACTPVGGNAGTGRGTCTMVLPAVGTQLWGRKITSADLARLVRHERGHCNGWPANHPK